MAVDALNVLMIVSEAVPFSKTGGLGDVGGALPAALARLGHRVTVVLPRYHGSPDGKPADAPVQPPWPGAPAYRLLDHDIPGGPRFRFVECPEYFGREGIYGVGAADYADNDRRFGLLAWAALQGADRPGEVPHVVHAHDWQAGLAAAYLRHRFDSRPGWSPVASVFTIHNLAYQGLFGRESVPGLGLGWNTFSGDGLEFWGQVSFLKSGIMFSDLVTTVSRRYALEIQTAEQGFGFEGVTRRRSDRLVGIPNGIDTDVWDPLRDPHLPAPYSADDLGGKAASKRALLERFGLLAGDALRRPVIGMVSRMVDQKGLDLIEAAASDLMQLGAIFVVLGTGERKYQDMWLALAHRYRDRVGALVGFDEGLAHLIEAGSDLFMMPSRFEPCGLNQMYSQRYGTVPVVRATGGLDDTVEQVDHATGVGTGFKFEAYTAEAFVATLRYALDWYGRPEAWRLIQQRGMRRDFSWDASARDYVQAFTRARRDRAEAAPAG